MKKHKVYTVCAVIALIVCALLYIHISSPSNNEKEPHSSVNLTIPPASPTYEICPADAIFCNIVQLDTLQTFTINYSTTVEWKEWGSNNHTAHIVLESDGIYIEQSKIPIENFPGREYQNKVKTVDIPFSSEYIQKNLGYISMELQRTNDDGTLTAVAEEKVYYIIDGEEMYTDHDPWQIIVYIQENETQYSLQHNDDESSSVLDSEGNNLFTVYE